MKLPHRIGGYTLLEVIGEGGQARVYRARQESTGRLVAAKLLHAKSAANPRSEARFRGDMKSLAQLDHGGIVGLIDFVRTDDGRPMIVMQLVEGGDLAERMQRHAPEPLDEVLAVVEQVAGALAKAHEIGILHRDVKPANVLIDEDGRCRLTDFGIARRIDDSTPLTEDGRSVGTALYMSPEQARGDRVDATTDLYSLAIVTFEMLTGRRPFEASYADEVQKQKLQTTPAFFEGDGVPQPVQDVICRALSSAPKKRPRSVLEFVAELREAIQSARAAAHGGRRQSEAAGRGALVRIGALVAIVAVLGFGASRIVGASGPPQADPGGEKITSGPDQGQTQGEDIEKAVAGTIQRAADSVLPAFELPPLPTLDELDLAEPRVDVVLLIDEPLAASRRTTPRDVTRALLLPLATELRAMDGVGSVSLPPLSVDLDGTDAGGIREQLQDLDHDIAVIASFERMPLADRTIPGPTTRKTKRVPAVRLRATVITAGAEAPQAVVENGEAVLASEDKCGRSVDEGLPSAVENAAGEVLAAARGEVDMALEEIAARGQRLAIGIVAPRHDRGAVKRFEATLAGAPALLGRDRLAINDYTFEEGDRSFVRTAVASARARDAVEIDAESQIELWSLRQKCDRATTIQFVRQSLEAWAQYDSALQALSEEYERRERDGSAPTTEKKTEARDEPASANSDARAADAPAESTTREPAQGDTTRKTASDLMLALRSDRPVELRHSIRLIVGSDLVLFEVLPLEPEPDPSEKKTDDGGGDAPPTPSNGDVSGSSAENLSRIMGEMAGSIYLPVGIAADGAQIPLGSAWVAGEGLLATNGHVVAPFSKFERVVVRRVDETGEVVEFNVKKAEAHPGYQELARLCLSMDVLEPMTLRPMVERYHDTFDVALIWLEPRDNGFDSLGQPFEFASDDEARSAGRGLPVAYMGFPCEASSNMLNLERPTPIGIRGSLTGAVDATVGAADPEYARLLRVDLPVVGGASGSVVFRADGKVIGLINSGAIIGLDERMTIGGLSRISLSGFAYVQRIDAVSEMLEGRTSEVVASHRAYWRESLERDRTKFQSWVAERFVRGQVTPNGRTIGDVELIDHIVVDNPVLDPRKLPDFSTLGRIIRGHEFRLAEDGDTVAVTLHVPLQLRSASIFYAGTTPNAIVNETPVKQFIWEGLARTKAAFRGFVLRPQTQGDEFRAPGTHLLLFRVN